MFLEQQLNDLAASASCPTCGKQTSFAHRIADLDTGKRYEVFKCMSCQGERSIEVPETDAVIERSSVLNCHGPHTDARMNGDCS